MQRPGSLDLSQQETEKIQAELERRQQQVAELEERLEQILVGGTPPPKDDADDNASQARNTDVRCDIEIPAGTSGNPLEDLTGAVSRLAAIGFDLLAFSARSALGKMGLDVGKAMSMAAAALHGFGTFFPASEQFSSLLLGIQSKIVDILAVSKPMTDPVVSSFAAEHPQYKIDLPSLLSGILCVAILFYDALLCLRFFLYGTKTLLSTRKLITSCLATAGAKPETCA